MVLRVFLVRDIDPEVVGAYFKLGLPLLFGTLNDLKLLVTGDRIDKSLEHRVIK